MSYYTLYDEESSRGYSENNPKPQIGVTDWIFLIIVGITIIFGILAKIEEIINKSKEKKRH